MITHELRPAPGSGQTVYEQWLQRSLAQLKSPAILSGAGLFGLFIALFAIVQFATPNLAGNDGYYHIKLAQIMGERRLLPPFGWLPLTVLNAEAYVDHHFLYHVLLIPFTLGDLREGAKWASIILPATTFIAGWILLRGQKVPYAALWAIGLFAVSEAFLYRMSMPRAQAVSLLVLLLGLHLLLTGRYKWLVPLSFLYVWLYDGFPLILLLAGVVVGTRLLFERKLDLAPMLYSGLGIALGLLINPYFPENLLFIYHHILPKVTDTTAVSVGREWYPYQTWTLVENSGLALLAFIAGIVALGFRDKRMNTATATVLFISVLFGVMLFKSRRFVEYFPAFVLIFCALAWSPLIKDWIKAREWVAREFPVVMTVLLIITVAWNIQGTQESLRQSKPYQRFADASAWLQTNTPAGSRVFQTDWDDFTRLYFYNTHNSYRVGLDPTYMQLYDAELYAQWVDVTKGRVEAPAQVIADTFGSDYVLTDLKHTGFLRQASADPGLEEVYRDKYAVIFRVAGQEIPSEGG